MQTAEELLERFAELYSDQPFSRLYLGRAITLWRDYFEYTGQHMIMIEEGWTTGEDKHLFKSEEILDEVNAPKE